MWPNPHFPADLVMEGERTPPTEIKEIEFTQKKMPFLYYVLNSNPKEFFVWSIL